MASDQQQRQFALEIVATLRKAGYEALWAGGCVRDQLLGLAPKDYDVATSAHPEEVRALFGKRRTLAIGASFGVISVLGGRNRDAIEVATFRSDGQYVDGRHPESVTFSTAEADAQRRDFTINGMFYDPVASRIVDYVGGQDDLRAGIVRAIGNAQARLSEDKLRMLRAVRFACCYRFSVANDTLAAIQATAGDILQVSGERIGAELERLLVHANRREGLALLHEAKLLAPLVPELAALHDAHPDRWIATLERMERLGEANLPLIVAAMLFDGASPRESKKVCRRLRWTNKTGERTAWLLEHVHLVADARETPWPRLQPALVHEAAGELLRLAEAEWSPRHPGIKHCRSRLALPADQLNPSPLVDGNDLIAAGIESGKHFRELLAHLRALQLEGKLSSRDQAIAEAKRWVG